MSELVFKPISLVLCEDVRIEASGQFTLVGAYPGDIDVTSVPAAMRLQAYVLAEVSGTGENSYFVEYRIKIVETGESLANFQGKLKIGSMPDVDGVATAIAFPSPPMEFEIKEACVFEAYWSSDEREWERFYSTKFGVSLDEGNLEGAHS